MSSSPSFSQATSRRALLRGSALGAAGIAALSFGVPRIVSAQTTPPWLGGDVPGTSLSSRQMAVAARVDWLGLHYQETSSLGNGGGAGGPGGPPAGAPRTAPTAP